MYIFLSLPSDILLIHTENRNRNWEATYEFLRGSCQIQTVENKRRK